MVVSTLSLFIFVFLLCFNDVLAVSYYENARLETFAGSRLQREDSGSGTFFSHLSFVRLKGFLIQVIIQSQFIIFFFGKVGNFIKTKTNQQRLDA